MLFLIELFVCVYVCMCLLHAYNEYNRPLRLDQLLPPSLVPPDRAHLLVDHILMANMFCTQIHAVRFIFALFALLDVISLLLSCVSTKCDFVSCDNDPALIFSLSRLTRTHCIALRSHAQGMWRRNGNPPYGDAYMYRSTQCADLMADLDMLLLQAAVCLAGSLCLFCERFWLVCYVTRRAMFC